MTQKPAMHHFGPERMRETTGTADDLLLLVEVIDAGGFTAASNRVGIPKSRLSRRISALEAQLGIHLILRSSRRFEVTEAGQRIYEHGRTIRNEMRAAMASALNQPAIPAGKLRIACPIALASLVVSRVATEFAVRNPHVRVSLATTKGTPESLSEQFDLILLPSSQSLPNSEMVAQHLTTAPFVLVAAPLVCEAIGKLREPEHMRGCDVIGWGSLDDSTRWHLVNQGGKSVDVNVHIRFSSDNLLVIRDAALQGLGIARLPIAHCAREIEEKKLHIVLPGWAPPPMSIYALYPSRRHISTAGMLFLKALKEAM
jgi:DNA-binding transcriptional LysR family regulator